MEDPDLIPRDNLQLGVCVAYEIPHQEVTPDFTDCLINAVQHISDLTVSLPTGVFGFFNASVASPFLEHFSFRLVNQLFFVFIEDYEQQLRTPTQIEQTLFAADLANGIPCVLTMRKTVDGWVPAREGWGLVDVETRQPISPPSLTSTEQIEISDWELQGFAVQVVKAHLEKSVKGVLSTNSNPDVTPSIFAVSEDHTPFFVQVSAARHPHVPEVDLSDMQKLKHRLSEHAEKGYVALVSVLGANSDLLFRGEPYRVKFDGLQEIF